MSKTHDFSLGVYENEKQNFIAERSSQNRFGIKFKKIFNKHKGGSSAHPAYDFTSGVRSLFKKDGIQQEIDKADAVLASLSMFATSPNGVNYDLNDALVGSYVRARFTYDVQYDDFSLIGYKITISSSLDSDAADKRKKSTYIERLNLATVNNLTLDPLENQAETFGVALSDVDGVQYGHYETPTLPAMTSGEMDDTFTTDASLEKNVDDNFIFNQNLQTEFDVSKTEFERYLKEYLQSTQYLNNMTLSDNDILVFSLGQFKDYIEDDKTDLETFLAEEEDTDRAKDDMKLIELMRIESSLKENIDKPHKIKSISFRFQKECTMPESGLWWEAKELSKIRDAKSLQKHCYAETFIEDLDNGNDITIMIGDKFWVYPNESFLTLANWQICIFVQTFLDIKTEVKKKWYQTGLGKLLIAIITVVLIILTENPVWAKVLLSATAVASQYGLIGGKLQMIITVAMMVYGVATVDFSTMGGLDMFNFAVNNVNMTANIVQIQKQASLSSQFAERQRVIDDYNLSKKQDEVMRYIYTDSYDEYSTFYNLLYKY